MMGNPIDNTTLVKIYQLNSSKKAKESMKKYNIDSDKPMPTKL